MPHKCAKCGAPAIAYCVDDNSVLCNQCLGLVHHPRFTVKHGNHPVVELIDTKHDGHVQGITELVLNSMLVMWLLYSIWGYNLCEEYLSGKSICPVLSAGRLMVKRFDENIFLYMKEQLTKACDTECSYWRLILDGWFRGLVSGSDSLILIVTTLPKALLFKVMLSNLLGPIFGAIYGFLGSLTAILVMKAEDGEQAAEGWVSEHFTRIKQLEPAWLIWVMKVPGKTWDRFKKSGILNGPHLLEKLCMALCLSSALRLAVVNISFSNGIAVMFVNMATSYELVLEPFIWYQLAGVCHKLHKSVGKLKGKAGPPKVPLTLWREGHDDIKQLLLYAHKRFKRTFNFYRAEAEDMLHVVIDDSFYMIVLLRLLGLVLPLSGVMWFMLSNLGMNDLVSRHSDWFHDGLGLEAGGGDKYISDKLFSFALGQGAAGMFRSGRGALENGSVLAFIPQIMWRLILPLIFYACETKWETLLKDQKTSIKKAWQEGRSGVPDLRVDAKGVSTPVEGSWKNGDYANLLKDFGSFWNQVPWKDWDGNVPAAQLPPPAPNRRASVGWRQAMTSGAQPPPPAPPAPTVSPTRSDAPISPKRSPPATSPVSAQPQMSSTQPGIGAHTLPVRSHTFPVRPAAHVPTQYPAASPIRMG